MLLYSSSSYFFFMLLSPVLCVDYSQRKILGLSSDRKVVLHWELQDSFIHFKLEGMTKGFLGLAFAYNDLPLDGFVGGVHNDGASYLFDLHLDYAGINFFMTLLNRKYTYSL